MLGTENPRLEDLKLLALAPGPNGTANFQFPRIWDLGGSKWILSDSGSPSLKADVQVAAQAAPRPEPEVY